MKKSKKTTSSRMQRFEEKRLQTRLVLALLGSLVLILFIILFGFRLLIGFSVLISQMQGKDDETNTNNLSINLPPTIDPLPLATSSGKLIISGRGQKDTNVILFINEEESKKIAVGEDGTFIISSITLPEGTNTIKAKAEDSKGKMSEFSNIVRTVIKRKPPILEIAKPQDEEIVTGEQNIINVEGKTEEDTDIRINDRFVVVKNDGTFTYPFPLNEGENTLEIKAIDRAGNSTLVSRKVTYNK